MLPRAGTKDAEFTCGSGLTEAKMVWTGGLIGEITPVNTSTKTFTIKFEPKSVKEPSAQKFLLPLGGPVMTGVHLTSTTNSILGTEVEEAAEEAWGEMTGVEANELIS